VARSYKPDDHAYGYSPLIQGLPPITSGLNVILLNGPILPPCFIIRLAEIESLMLNNTRKPPGCQALEMQNGIERQTGGKLEIYSLIAGHIAVAIASSNPDM